MSNSNIAIIVDRFQVPALHAGHKYLIEKSKEKCARIVFVLCDAGGKSTFRNPIDYLSRMEMLFDYCPGCSVYQLTDCASDEVWLRNLEKIIDKATQRYEQDSDAPVLYGGPDSFLESFPDLVKSYRVVKLLDCPNISGSETRKSVDRIDHEYFRAGMVFAMNNTYPSVKATVDVAIMHHGFVLMARKPHETGLRFVGGFADVESPSYENDAWREVKEETGLIVGDMKYIGSCLVSDWRFKLERDKPKTLFFMAKYLGGRAVPSDDICGVEWLPVSVLRAHYNEIVVPEHHALVGMLMSWFDKLGAPSAVV